MMQLFTHSTSSWVRYDKYVIRKADNGKRYLTAADGAVPTIINPFEEVQQIMQYYRAGDVVQVDVKRLIDGEYKDLQFQVTLGKRPEE